MSKGLRDHVNGGPSRLGRGWVAVVAVAVGALVLAACGSTSASSSSTSSTAPAGGSTSTTGTTSPGSANGVVDQATSTSYGSILADSSGQTLYMLTADSATKSTCTGACVALWPPLLVSGSPKAGTGVAASKFGTVTRAGGEHQVTYNGHPLYRFAHDTAAGQTNGEGIDAFGGYWYVVSTTGSPVTAAVSGGTTTTKPTGY